MVVIVIVEGKKEMFGFVLLLFCELFFKLVSRNSRNKFYSEKGCVLFF